MGEGLRPEGLGPWEVVEGHLEGHRFALPPGVLVAGEGERRPHVARWACGRRSAPHLEVLVAGVGEGQLPVAHWACARGQPAGAGGQVALLDCD